MRRRLRVALVLASCGGAPPEPARAVDAGAADAGVPAAPPDAARAPDAGAALELVLGEGPAPVRPLGDGDPVAVVVGPQGLQMIVLGVRARGFEPGDAARPSPRDPVLRTTCTLDGALIATGQRQLAMTATRDGFHELADGWTPFLAANGGWQDRAVSCTATLIDAAGRRASVQRSVVPRSGG